MRVYNNAENNNNTDSQSVVRSMIDLAHGIGLETVAVGVESLADCAMLADISWMRADSRQSWLSSHPVSRVYQLAWRLDWDGRGRPSADHAPTSSHPKVTVTGKLKVFESYHIPAAWQQPNVLAVNFCCFSVINGNRYFMLLKQMQEFDENARRHQAYWPPACWRPRHPMIRNHETSTLTAQHHQPWRHQSPAPCLSLPFPEVLPAHH